MEGDPQGHAASPEASAIKNGCLPGGVRADTQPVIRSSRRSCYLVNELTADRTAAAM